ncbi:hypothetical protein MRX96_005012 [Rhipicephalus microplus]
MPFPSCTVESLPSRHCRSKTLTHSTFVHQAALRDTPKHKRRRWTYERTEPSSHHESGIRASLALPFSGERVLSAGLFRRSASGAFLLAAALELPLRRNAQKRSDDVIVLPPLGLAAKLAGNCVTTGWIPFASRL